VGIEPSRGDNYPHEFSGGIRQRALIAMALACNPDLLIADEPGTALDVIVQAQVLRLIRELKNKLNLAIIMISHDLSIISETCDRIAIMYLGKIMEMGVTEKIIYEPLHPYTKALISVVPVPDPAAKRSETAIPGEIPSPISPPPGCRFHTRCPVKIGKIFITKEQALIDVGDGHYVACHKYT